jgi:hypothetical protein
MVCERWVLLCLFFGDLTIVRLPNITRCVMQNIMLFGFGLVMVACVMGNLPMVAIGLALQTLGTLGSL